MPLVNFSNLDFDQVKISLREYLKANSNFTDYDFQGSNLSSIIDLLAYNTYITSYNANMVTNEVFIDSATLRENVVSLARNIGYLPKSRKAAAATISFYVDCTNITPTPSSITLSAGPVAASAGAFGRQSFIFSIVSDITVPVREGIAKFDEITVYQGSLLTSNFTYSARTPNQKFILPNSGIDTELIRVNVRGSQQSTTKVNYTSQNSLFDIDSTSKVFIYKKWKMKGIN